MPGQHHCTSKRLRWSRFFHPFHPTSDSGRPRKGPALAPPGSENPEVTHFKRFLVHLSVPPPSSDLFACPPPSPIRSARVWSSNRRASGEAYSSLTENLTEPVPDLVVADARCCRI